MQLCPICEIPVTSYNLIPTSDMFNVHCTRCGNYHITDEAVETINSVGFSPRQRANASAWLRENQVFKILTTNLTKLVVVGIPSFNDRADKILLALEKHTEHAGQFIKRNESWLSWGWCINYAELNEILSFLETQPARIEAHPNIIDYSQFYKISPNGWQRIEELKNYNINSNQGFVAIWFDDEMKNICDTTIFKGIKDAGYKPHRVDQREYNDKIDDEIIAQIRQSRFVLADFTGHRGGVYYEAGFAKGLGLEVIWTCRQDEIDNLHFDVRQYNCIPWEVAKLSEFRKRIKNRIESVFGKGTHR